LFLGDFKGFLLIFINKNKTVGRQARLANQENCGKISASVPHETAGCSGPSLLIFRIFRPRAALLRNKKIFGFQFSVYGLRFLVKVKHYRYYIAFQAGSPAEVRQLTQFVIIKIRVMAGGASLSRPTSYELKEVKYPR